MSKVDHNFNRKAGYIYVVKNKFHKSNLYKVGRTERTVSERLREEYKKKGTFAPMDLYPIAQFAVADPQEAEIKIHQKLSNYKAQGEWFEIDIDKLYKIIENSIKEFQNFSKIKTTESSNKSIEKIVIKKNYFLRLDIFNSFNPIDKKREFEVYLSAISELYTYPGGTDYVDEGYNIPLREFDEQFEDDVFWKAWKFFMKKYKVPQKLIVVSCPFDFTPKVLKIIKSLYDMGFSEIYFDTILKEKDKKYIEEAIFLTSP